MKFKDLKIGTQLFLGLTSTFVFVLFISVVAYRQSSQIHSQTELIYNHPLKVRRAISNFKIDILNIQIIYKDLNVLNTDDKNTQVFAEMNAAASDANNQIDILYAQYLGPKSDIDSLDHTFSKWYAELDLNRNRMVNGRMNKLENQLVSSDDLKRHHQDVFKRINIIDNFAVNKIEQLYTHSQKLSDNLNMQLLIIVLIVLILLGFLNYVLITNMLKPIKLLSEATKKFREGDLSIRSIVNSTNEYGELSQSFNSMVEDIESSTNLSKNTNELAALMLMHENPEEFFQTVLPQLAKVTNSQVAAIYLLSEDKSQYNHFLSFGSENELQKSFSALNYEGEFGAVLSTHKIQYVSKIPIDSQFVFHTVPGKIVPREIITIPILNKNEIIAILSLASIRSYTNHSKLIVENIAGYLSARIDGVFSFKKLQRLSAKLENQNNELGLQKNEMEAQAIELKEQNRELEMQKKQLHEASQLKTNFLSNMSHELRTPLNSVIALSGVLIRRLTNKINNEEYSYIEVIERNGKHLLSLINDILDISRIEAGREEIEITKFRADELLTELVNMIQPQAKQKNLELVLNESESIILESDVSKCHHILQNLIGNAVKFTEKGTVGIDIRQVDKNIEISVSDTGIGISDKNRDRIFDEFRQADASTSRKYGGTGLGLSIAKKYANLLGGNIRVESEIGKGSVFILSLPLKYDKSNRIDPMPESRLEYKDEPMVKFQPTTIEKTILLVDDSEPAIVQMKDFLSTTGYKVLAARNGAEALKMIEQVIPDVMILDLMMPGVDGFSVLETLRNEDKTAGIPVLILTAKHITKDDLRFLKRNNVHQLIQKGDVDKVEFMTAIQKVLSPVELVKPEEPTLERPEISGKPNVLIVEDNFDNMVTVKAIIGDKFNVFEAVDGIEAVKMANIHIPHLILMDIALPNMDGIQAFKQIRQSGVLAHIPIIALTASAMTTDREIILAHGFEAYIAKPIDEKEFFKTIDFVLYGK